MGAEERVEGWLLEFSRTHPHGYAQPIGGRGTRGGAMSMAEAGALLARCSDHECAVGMFWLGHDYSRKAAFYAILDEAREQWMTRRREYGAIDCDDEVRELAALVLEETRMSPLKRTKSMRACWMAVSLGVWGRRYERAHRALAGSVWKWLGEVENRIKRNRRMAM